MEKMIYLAAQYLAAAGISFLEKKPDDSHTNLGFSMETGSMQSRPLNDQGARLDLDLKTLTLEWKSGNETVSLPLDGKKHAEVLQWLGEVTSKEFENSYSYDFHYEFPYEISDDFEFKVTDSGALEKLAALRGQAEEVLRAFLEKYELDSEIRIWPHHFDTGAYAVLKGSKGIAVGLGLAIPDSLVNDHYFYLSEYQGHGALETTGFDSLEQGSWHNEGFKGATLPASDTTSSQALSFLSSAFTAYKN